jgi:hypothetical protein
LSISFPALLERERMMRSGIQLVPQFTNRRIRKIFVELHHSVDDTVRSEFDDPIRDRINELVVVAIEQQYAAEFHQAIVER